MNELIRVEINENDEQIVDAKELYEYLVFDRSQWSRWYKKNILDDELFVENSDYITLDIMSNGNQTKNFIMKIDMAKELCMLARTERGKMARKYFLEVEKAWNDPTMILARANKIQQKQIEEFKSNLLELKPKAEFYDDVHSTLNTIDMATVAKVLNFKGVGRNKLFEVLRGEGILQYDNSPYQIYENKGWFKLILGTRVNQCGEKLMTKKTVVYAKGMEEIAKILKNLGYIKRDEVMMRHVS